MRIVGLEGCSLELHQSFLSQEYTRFYFSFILTFCDSNLLPDCLFCPNTFLIAITIGSNSLIREEHLRPVFNLRTGTSTRYWQCKSCLRLKSRKSAYRKRWNQKSRWKPMRWTTTQIQKFFFGKWLATEVFFRSMNTLISNNEPESSPNPEQYIAVTTHRYDNIFLLFFYFYLMINYAAYILIYIYILISCTSTQCPIS